MSGTTGIPWTGATANFFTWRCRHRSPGCDNCYAEHLTDRWQGPGAFTSGPPVLLPNRLLLPLTDRAFLEKDKVFYASMSEPFDPRIPLADLALAFAVIAVDRRHTWQVLSKLQGVMHSRLTKREFPVLVRAAAEVVLDMLAKPKRLTPARREALEAGEKAADDWQWPLPNLWLGVSTENQHWADKRIPVLLRTPATIRFISAEPLLGHIGLHRYLPGSDYGSTPGLDWVICGGESGKTRREMNMAWLTAMHEQCKTAGVPFFTKQDSALRPDQQGRIPAEHWVREFPEVLAA